MLNLLIALPVALFNTILNEFYSPCSSCNAPSKYRCPKCSVFSCSLDCVKAHKVETKCDGIRDKTAFVPIDEFKDRHLLSGNKIFIFILLFSYL